MASVTILDQTYTLPAIATERFRAIQEQVQAQQQVIQTGLRPQSRRWGMLRRPPRTLTPDERWHELDLLVSNYDAIIAELSVSKEAYAAFFGQLAAGVQQILVRQSEAMWREEEIRLAHAQHAFEQQDETAQRLVHENGERLMHGVRMLSQAVLLLLRKIALCQESLTRLAEDQDLQRRVLTELTGRLELHRDIYRSRQRIDQLVEEAKKLAGVALHFEEYMRDHLGPLQGILEQVVCVDSDLRRAVEEIADLTWRLVQQQGLTSLPGSELFDERWLRFLTAGQLKKERLAEMLERLERQDDDIELEIDIATSASGAASPVLTALDNIRTLVEVRLAPLAPAPPEPTLVDRFGIKFALIPAGTFQMGSDHGSDDEKPMPVHTVRLSRPFYLGIYPVTQRQWQAIMGNNPSHFKYSEHPVEQVSWDEVQVFIRSLNTHEGRTLYRLPTEAEWEYAARAGATGDYCFGDDVTQLAQYAWYLDNTMEILHVKNTKYTRHTTRPVGQLQPNAWGLYDMHGNVQEWVHDWYKSQGNALLRTLKRTVVNPAGPKAGEHRVVRGGSWGAYAHRCRSASRNHEAPDTRRDSVGFRLLREVQ